MRHILLSIQYAQFHTRAQMADNVDMKSPAKRARADDAVETCAMPAEAPSVAIADP